jgi:DNA-binding PadR family transcriptional regulator
MARAGRTQKGLKWAVLGLVAEHDAYGYQLVQSAEELLGDAYQVSPGAIYWSLEALEKKGYVVARGSHAVGTARSPRVVYEITAKGRTAVEDWIKGGASSFEAIRADLVSKLPLIRPEHVPDVLRQIEDAQLECLTKIRLVSTRIERVTSDPWHGPLLRRSFEYPLSQLEARRVWLNDTRATVVTLHAQWEAGKLGAST